MQAISFASLSFERPPLSSTHRSHVALLPARRSQGGPLLDDAPSPNETDLLPRTQHTSPQDCLTVIDGIVYDMGPILDSHPGGRGVLLTPDVAGQDCSKLFFALHRSEILADFQHLIVGKVRDAVPNAFEYPTAGTLSLVPHAEPGWLSKGYKSPYYDASHYALQAATRLFFDTEVKRYAREWEASGQRPSLELMELMGKEGVEINAMRMGPGKHVRPVLH